jgi:polysaccharide biosynthesis PFTS motif protein
MFRRLFNMPGTRTWHRARVRKAMRGFKILRDSGRLEIIASVNQDLTICHLGIPEHCFSRIIMGAAKANAELALRQYLLVRLCGVNLNKALLCAVVDPCSGVSFQLPRPFRHVLEKHGFKVNHYRCAMLWQLYCIMLFCFGVVTIFRLFAKSFISSSVESSGQQPYVYFSDLARNNLPQEEFESGNYHIISWYMQWTGRDEDIKSIRHSVKDVPTMMLQDARLEYQAHPVPLLQGMVARLYYLGWGIGACVVGLLDYVRGRWWSAMLLNQSAMAAITRLAPGSHLAEKYFFHGTSYIYRYLWTYEAEKKGAQLFLYLYSTNCEPIKRGEDIPAVPFGFRAMNWPNILVWDSYQSGLIKRALGNSVNRIIAGPVWFSSKGNLSYADSRKRVALFDVTPVREAFFRELCVDFEFYTPQISRQFIQEILDVVQRHGMSLVWKRKRNIGKLAHPVYRKFVNSLDSNPAIDIVDPDLSANSVIETCTAAISMPFTSTAIIAREMGVPSVYYDPVGILQKDDWAAHGIPIIQGKSELEDWLRHQAGVPNP